MAAWLRGLGLGRYEAAFRDNDIGADVLHDLTAADLREIGVASVGDRRRLLSAIAALRGPSHTPGDEPPPPPPAQAAPTATAPPGDAGSDWGADGQGAERRQLTVMFCDLVGSTALASRLDPEDLREVIGAYHGCVARTIASFDGFVARFMGDGVLVYFGYPQAHEHDAERAARAGLELVAAVRALDAHPDVELRARVGIASGLVVVGDLIASGEGQEHDVVGATPNLAARLQAMAEPSSVVISASTRRLLGSLFEVRDLGTVQARGFAAPVQAWQVLRESGVESRFEAFHSAALTPLVGREEELDLLLRRWRRAKNAEGQAVLLSAEPGSASRGS
jgi:class 3 adenylate cyclase